MGENLSCLLSIGIEVIYFLCFSVESFLWTGESPNADYLNKTRCLYCWISLKETAKALHYFFKETP